MDKESLLWQRMQEVLLKIQEINLEDLLKKMEGKPPFYLIDVREDSEWNQGSLPLALHVTRGKLELNIENITANTEADIILYCGGGTRSALATESLQAMGYKNVKSLKGGFRGWQEAGFPLEIHIK